MNRISIIIPCHRVIDEARNQTGYGEGIRRKKWLLDFGRETFKCLGYHFISGDVDCVKTLVTWREYGLQH